MGIIIHKTGRETMAQATKTRTVQIRHGLDVEIVGPQDGNDWTRWMVYNPTNRVCLGAVVIRDGDARFWVKTPGDGNRVRDTGEWAETMDLAVDKVVDLFVHRILHGQPGRLA